MNNKIKQCAEQAGFIPDNAPDMNSVLEKFAALIIQECVTIAQNERHNMQFLASNPPQSAAAYDIERRIKTLFGVE